MTTLQQHLAALEAELEQRGRLRDRLTEALRAQDGEEQHGARGARALMKVVETMTMFEQYVHGYHAEEDVRLRDQASTLVDLVHEGVAFAPGSRVLEVGCGVGAQTVTLLERNPDIVLTCVDWSRTSLDAAQARVRAAGLGPVQFIESDLFALPDDGAALSAGSVDHVFVCFLLEHLPRPAEALARLREVLRPGGTLTVVEGDHGSTYFHPDSEAAREAVACQVTLQGHAGGDAMIGRRLYPLLVEAGYDDVRVAPRQVYVDASRPDLVDGFIRRTFTAMVHGVREQALAAGLMTADRFDEGVGDLERTTGPDGVFCYTFFGATASRRG